jgi:hypothetical protein
VFSVCVAFVFLIDFRLNQMRQQSYYFLFRPATHQLNHKTTAFSLKQDLGVTDKASTEPAPSFNKILSRSSTKMAAEMNTKFSSILLVLHQL